MSNLTEFEVKILKEIAEPGSQEGLFWGAAMGMALECLQGYEYVTKGYKPVLTQKGKEVLVDYA